VGRGVSRPRLWLAVTALAVVGCAAAFVTPPPTNPVVDSAAGLEANAPLPPDVRAALRTSCYDCHSDETRWPWYATAFPVSLLIERDVEQGRGQVNFSRWADYNPFDRADKLDEICTHVRDASMPLPHYRWLHPGTSLSDAQVEVLCAWAGSEADRLMGGA
jgi:hypothetical protein